jgi:triacylglycerol lipase
MAASRVPMLLAYAELDPSDFHRQAEQARAALCEARRCPAFVQLRGHSHMSEVYAINTADTALTDAIRTFTRTAP